MSLRKKIIHLADKAAIRVANKLCALFGHRNIYKDYSNYIQADGNKYAFKASRCCTRCNQHAYFYSEWVVEEKSKIDYEGDYYALPKIVINKVVYT